MYGLDQVFETIFAIFASATLLLTFAAAAYGVCYEAQPDTTLIRKLLAMLGGCLVGVAVTVFIVVGFLAANSIIASSTVSEAGVTLGPFLGAWMSYGVAGKVAAGVYPP